MKEFRYKLNTIGYGHYMLTFGIVMLALGLLCRAFGLDAIGCICFVAGGTAIIFMLALVAIELHQDKVLNAEAIAADAKLEAAIKKKSFALPYAGGEIWTEHLDGLYTYKDTVLQKFQQDMPEMLKPSAPSAIAVALAETRVDAEILQAILDACMNADKTIRKVVFIGLNRRCRQLLNQLVSVNRDRIRFMVHYIDDFEKAKEWLMS